MTNNDPRVEWPKEWLAFELLRRRADYRAAWKDYLANRSADPHGWAPIIEKIAPPTNAARIAKPDQPDMLSNKWAAPFGLQHLLDPAKDAETHDHIPWRPGSAAVPVAIVRGPESFVFDAKENPRLANGARRFVALRFDLGLPLEAQLSEARQLLTEVAGKVAAATRGRFGKTIVRHLDVLDMLERGNTHRQIGQRFFPDRFASTQKANADKLAVRARELAEKYLDVVKGTTGAESEDN